MEVELDSEESIVGYTDGTLGVSHCCAIGEENGNVEESEDREDADSCVALMKREFFLLAVLRNVKTSVAADGSNFILHPSIMASKTSRYA